MAIDKAAALREEIQATAFPDSFRRLFGKWNAAYFIQCGQPTVVVGFDSVWYQNRMSLEYAYRYNSNYEIREYYELWMLEEKEVAYLAEAQLERVPNHVRVFSSRAKKINMSLKDFFDGRF